MTDHNLEQLQTYQLARELKRAIFALPHTPDKRDKYIRQHLRRTATSVTANIAEGYGRYNLQEKLQFFRVARASLMELTDHLDSAALAGITEPDTLASLEDSCREVVRVLNGYLRYLQEKAKTRGVTVRESISSD